MAAVAVETPVNEVTTNEDETDDNTTGVITAVELDRREPFEPDSVSFAPVALTYRVMNALHVRTHKVWSRFHQRERSVGRGRRPSTLTRRTSASWSSSPS